MSLNVGSKIRGLVDASGAGGCSIGSSNSWSLVFNLAAHCMEGEVTRSALRCELPMSREDVQQWMSQIKPYSVVEATVAGLTDRGDALLSHLQKAEDDDSDLVAIREELLIPVIVQTPLFGPLVLDRRFGHYDGRMEWCGATVDLSLECADHCSPESAVAAAESLFHSQDEWNRRVKEFAADQLLELKNDSWLGEDEEELSRDGFASRMTLQAVSVDESGDFSFWHDDGDLFWGHTILISGNLAGGLTDADIPG